jgi:hypothetical protein
MTTESNGKNLKGKTDNRFLKPQQSSLPSIASFKTSSVRDNVSTDKHIKRTDLLEIPDKSI